MTPSKGPGMSGRFMKIGGRLRGVRSLRESVTIPAGLTETDSPQGPSAAFFERCRSHLSTVHEERPVSDEYQYRHELIGNLSPTVTKSTPPSTREVTLLLILRPPHLILSSFPRSPFPSCFPKPLSLSSLLRHLFVIFPTPTALTSSP